MSLNVLNKGIFSYATAAAGYTANDGALFDGTNDYLRITGALSGSPSDTKTILLSAWFKLTDNLESSAIFSYVDGNAFGQYASLIDVTNMVFRGESWDTSGVDRIHRGISNNDVIDSADGWSNILISVNSATTAIQHMYYNDVEVLNTNNLTTDKIFDWTGTGVWNIGRGSGNGKDFNGALQEIYVTNEYLDLSTEANRRKFIDGSGKPVDLGSDGSTPTGTQAIIYLNNVYTSFETNLGSGGNFTVTGALADAGTSPSD